MHWVVGTWLITSLLGLGMGHNTLFEGYDRTLSGYHLCNMTESVSETHVISYTTSYIQKKPCGGWLPWTMCDVTVYKTEYRTQEYAMPKQVMKCCHGYEQVGSYCALSLNRSAEFTSKPGLCPTTKAAVSLSNNSKSSGSVCNWDIDCPQWQKCCLIEKNSSISQCSDTVPSVNRTWCFNVTITVKTAYELVTRDKGLFNHTRLLHSVVTGALGTDQISVHYVWSKSAGPFTTSSSLLVCSPKDILLANVSTKLYGLGIIEEVTDVVVQDVDECAHLDEFPQLNSCSSHASCMNTVGSYICTCHPGFHDLIPSQPGTVCMAPSVTTQPPPPPTTTSTTPSWTTHSPPDGQSLAASARLKNVNYTEALKDPNSDEYKMFCDSVINEILLSLSPEVHALVISRQVMIQITSLSPGSVIANFSIIFQPGSNLNMSSVSSALMGSLQNSSIYVVDSIYIAATIDPTTKHPGVPSDSTGTTTSSTTIVGNPTMSSTVSTTHVQPNTTIFSTSTATTGPTTVMPSTSTTTLAHTTQYSVTASIYQTSNYPPHLISYLAVECIPGFLTVYIQRDALHTLYIQESSLYLGKPECGLSGGNTSHVWLITSWEKCGTKLAHNDTHNLANVTLYNSGSNASVRMEVPVICSYPRGVLISMGYAPSGYFDMINDPVAGSGSFQVTLRLLNGTTPLPVNYTLSPDDKIIVEVGVNTTISRIKVVIEECWATSSSDSSNSPSYLFQEQGCKVTNPYTTILQNGNDTVALVSVQIFKVVNLNIIYLHCQIQICVEIQDGTCRPSCSRTSRSSNVAGVKQATIGPIKRIPPIQTDTSNTLQSVGFIVLGVGVFLFSLTAIAGLVYHKRKIGNYNFRCKPQQQNFTYNVFDI